MKPLKLVMQAFGPYPGREEIDFEDLAKAGIFLIKGPTGSGKTTIFDAMSMALYGKSTGEDDKNRDGRNKLLNWRCNQADWGTETIVEFTFSAQGRVYQFKRRLIPKTKNITDVYSMCVMDEEGNFQPLSENTREDAMNKKAEELIGLNSNQFRQVVLLPQGQFERFLTANSDEKEAILSRLFRADEWEKYAEKLYKSADERLTELMKIKQQVDNSLLEEGPEFTELSVLENGISDIKAQRTVLNEKHTAFDGENRKKALNAEKELYKEYGKLHDIEKKKALLEAEAAVIRNTEERLTRADRAEVFREPVNEVKKLRLEYERLQGECDKEQGQLPVLEAAERESVQAYEELVKNSPVDELNRKTAGLEGKRDLYGSIEAAGERVIIAVKMMDKARGELNSQKALCEKATLAASKKLALYNEADLKAHDYRERYYRGIYGELATELEEGRPCPVCGSTHHPSPAVKMADSVSKEMLEKAEKTAENAKKDHAEAEEMRKQADEKLKACEDSFKNAETNARVARAEYDEKSKGLVEGIGSASELEAMIGKYTREITAFNTNKEKLENKKNTAHDEFERHKAALTTLRDNCDIAKEKYENGSMQLRAQLLKAGYEHSEDAVRDWCSPEERKSLQEKINTHNANYKTCQEELEKQQTLLEGKTEPDANSFEEREAEIEAENNEYIKADATLSQNIERLSKKYKDLGSKMKKYDANIGQAEEDHKFASLVKGSNGISLQRYVLGIMFDQIISEANNHLNLVHGGRYQLRRTDEKTGNSRKKGLDLKVRDNRRPDEERPVSSLSGGEKFLVSLALSIGMSAVAQNSGLHIEALFIDEGFGTLDDSSISDAMDILECVQRSNGMIGIISHVGALEGTISKHLEVIKNDNGSYIKRC